MKKRRLRSSDEHGSRGSQISRNVTNAKTSSLETLCTCMCIQLTDNEQDQLRVTKRGASHGNLFLFNLSCYV